MSPAPMAGPCGCFGGGSMAARKAPEHDRAPSTPKIFVGVASRLPEFQLEAGVWPRATVGRLFTLRGNNH